MIYSESEYSNLFYDYANQLYSIVFPGAYQGTTP